MGTSNVEIVMDFLVTVGVTLLVVIVFYWIWILATMRRVKVRKMRMNRHVRGSEPNVYIPGLRDLIASRPDEARCIHCGARMPTHYHGCPYAAQWCIETTAKPGG